MSAMGASSVLGRVRGASRQRVVVSVVLVVVLVVAAGLWWWREHRSGLHLRAEFTSAVGIYPGNEVRILDVPIGSVDSVTPHGRAVTIAMTLDPGVNVRADTYAVIVAPNLVSDRYVELTGAYAHGPKLANDATIGLSRTRTPVELDQLYRGLTSLFTALGPNGANKNGALSRLLEVGAANLKGNGTKFNQTITALSKSGRTLAGSQRNIFATIDQLSQFTTTLATHDKQLASANTDLASVTQTLADDRGDFAEAVHSLASSLLLVKRFVQAHRAALTGNVNRLSKVAVSLGTRRESLAKALEAAPLLLQNFLNAYDPQHNLLRGRTDLNELTVWARQNAGNTSATTSGSDVTTSGSTAFGSGSAPVTSAAASTSSVPAGLLPAVGSTADVP